MVGLYFMCAGLAVLYITMQILPLFEILSFIKEDWRTMSIEEWLFWPFIAFLLLIPLVGAMIAIPLLEECNKWLERISLIAVDAVIVGLIISIVDIL